MPKSVIYPSKQPGELPDADEGRLAHAARLDATESARATSTPPAEVVTSTTDVDDWQGPYVNAKLSLPEVRALLCPDPMCVPHLLDRIKAERKLRADLYWLETWQPEWDRWSDRYHGREEA